MAPPALPSRHNLTKNIITVRPLSDRSREIIYKVFRYFTKECKDFKRTPYSKYFQQVYKRFTDATGVSNRNLTYVLNEARGEGPILNCTSTGLDNAKKDLDDLDYGIIRDIIIDSHLKHIDVDLIWLTKQLEDKISFNASEYALKKILRLLGFRFFKTEDNLEILLENHKKRLIRIQYLDEIKKRRDEGRHMVFMNEVNVHVISEKTKDAAGTSQESVTKITKSKVEQIVIVHAWNTEDFSPRGFLIFKFDDIQKNYEKWLCTEVLPNLPENSVLVMTSSLYPDENKIKTSPHAYSTTQEMLEWLNINEDYIDKTVIVECRNWTKPQIYDLICKTKKLVKVANSAKKILAETGFCLLQLPPYHWGFNPIHYIWPKLSVYLAEQHVGNDNIESMLMAEVNTITPDEWIDALKKSITYEKTTMVNEWAMDKFIDNLNLKKDQDSDDEVSEMSDEE